MSREDGVTGPDDLVDLVDLTNVTRLPQRGTAPVSDPGAVPSDDDRDPADRVADAVTSVPGVHGLHAGVAGEIATYLPGRRVNGVRLRGDDCEIHLALAFGVDIAATTDQVRAAVRPLVGGAIDVVVEDVVAAGS